MRLFALFTLIGSMAQAAPSHVQLGDYQGVDESGQFCDVYVGTPFGSEHMGFFWFVNAGGSYRVSTAYDPQPASPGKIKGTEDLMADGWDHGRPYFRNLVGAPIGASLITANYTIRLKGNVPTRLDFATDYGKSFCSQLKYTGPYRP